ncbi:MAG: hypothetical protein HGA85_01825, partial [Nanoarchaeota archaeon]|nr:hypothetical protein [Nanoarchaeota archaeon]
MHCPQPIQPKMYFFTHEVKGDTLYLYLSLSNTDLVEHTYAIESYLSDGTKEEAAQDLVTVGPGMRENMTLTKKVSGLSGNYSLKIKVLRDDRKTPYLLSDTLFFEGTKVFIESIPEEEKITGPIPEPATETTIAQQQITGNVVFESKSEKQSMLKTYLSVGAVAVSLLLAAGFIRTRATK